MFLRKILTNDAYKMDRRVEIGGGKTGKGRGAAQQVLAFSSWGLDVVDGDGTADEDLSSSNRPGRVLGFRVQNSTLKRKREKDCGLTRQVVDSWR